MLCTIFIQLLVALHDVVLTSCAIRRCMLHQTQLLFTGLLEGKTSSGGVRPARSPTLNNAVRAIKSVLLKFSKSTKLYRAYKLKWSEMFASIVLLPVFDVLTRCARFFHASFRFDMCHKYFV